MYYHGKFSVTIDIGCVITYDFVTLA